MDFRNDPRIVMTLDAGGTHMAFGAVKGGKPVIAPLVRASHGTDLDTLLRSIMGGFRAIHDGLPRAPAAISFAFPGPADYAGGIIGDLENLPAFRGGVALGPMLADAFGIPVFINNDGDLFAYGEAMAGLLPEINRRLAKAGSQRRYRNLLGVTFGTGFGAGIVSHGRLFTGDNSAAGEINRLRNVLLPDTSVEDSVSIRGVQRVYAHAAGIPAARCPSPEQIFEIGMGRASGDRAAAVAAFDALADAAGDALANAASLTDGLVVIGGGLSGAHALFLTRLVAAMNQPFTQVSGDALPRLESRVFNLEDAADLAAFMAPAARQVAVPFSNRRVDYRPDKRIGVGISCLGTLTAVSIGAYALALDRLDQHGDGCP